MVAFTGGGTVAAFDDGGGTVVALTAPGTGRIGGRGVGGGIVAAFDAAAVAPTAASITSTAGLRPAAIACMTSRRAAIRRSNARAM